MGKGKWSLKGGVILKVVKYEVNKHILTVGFNVADFVVYTDIYYDENKTKQELLQQAYEQCRKSIEYEKTQEEPSILWDGEEGEVFVPEDPKVSMVKLCTNKDQIIFGEDQESEIVELYTITKDQYGDDINIDVSYTTTFGTIENNILTIPKVTEFSELSITANTGEISDSKTIYLYPYVEPIPPEPSEIDVLNKRLDIQDKVIEEILFDIIPMLGGE